MADIEIGDWITRIGSSRPSTGTAHRIGSIIRIVDGYTQLQTACGLKLHPNEILQNLGRNRKPPAGACRRCAAR
jgi:hypothetical protein